MILHYRGNELGKMFCTEVAEEILMQPTIITEQDSQDTEAYEETQEMQDHEMEETQMDEPQDSDNNELATITETPLSILGARRKAQLTRITLDEETEKDLGEWYKAHPILYDKGRRDYKDTTKKRLLYEEKARSIQPPVTGPQLLVWINGMRTRYGRMTEGKRSKGLNNARLTEREQWIFETFGFLGSHIFRKRKVNTAASQLPGGFNKVEVVSIEEEEGDEGLEDPPHAAQTPAASASPSTANQPSTSRGMKRKSSEEDVETLLAKLLRRSEAAPELQHKVDTTSKPQSLLEEKMQNWLVYLGSEIKDLHASVWDRWTMAVFTLLQQFKVESRALKDAEKTLATKVYEL